MTELSAGAWRLYCFLLRCRNQETGRAFPSIKVSAEAIETHPNNVYRLRKELTAIGWVEFDGDEVKFILGGQFSKNAKSSVDKTGDSKTDPDFRKNAKGFSKNAKNFSKNANAYKEQQDELTRLKEQDEVLPGATASVGGLRQRECSALFVELYRAVGGYDAPYQFRTADGVHLAKLLKTCEQTRWPMTVERFTQAARHFFQTPRSSHTLADLAAHFSDFYKNAIDRFNKPVEANGNGRHQVPRNETYGERVGRQMEELAQQSAATYAPPIGDSGPDTADTGAPWPAIEVGGF